MSDLLPISATKQERDISLSVERAGSVAFPNRQLWNPQTCPAGILPWLGWSLSVDDWREDWTEQQKRDAIADAVAYHKRKGTVGAVRRALQAIGYEAIILEQVDGPYTFGVYIADAPAVVTDAMLSEAEAAALRSKNVRSHLATVGSFMRTDGAFKLLTATMDGSEDMVWPFTVTSLESAATLRLLSASHDVVTTVGPSAINLHTLEFEGDPLAFEGELLTFFF